MNIKFGLVAGAAVACVVMSGCKASKVQSADRPVRPAPRIVESAPTPVPAPKAVKPYPAPKAVKPASAPAPEPLRCKCAPGTVHTAPCVCGASDCKCKVKPVEPEYTLYRIKGGDMLSSICATYGLKQSKVLELNPGLEPNKLFVGKKIKLPGKIELKDADAKSLAKKPVAKRQSKSANVSSAKISSYKGATKEYVVKSGDSLGKIAYSNGITIRCLKDMNGLKKNTIRIGQKLKIPAEKPTVVAKAVPAPVKPASAPVVAPQPAPAASAAESKSAEVAPEAAPAAPADVEAAPAAPEAAPAVAEPVKEEAPVAETASALTHTVKEGEDTVSIAIMYGVSPSAVMDLNDLKNTDSLKVGQVLKLPANAKVQ